MTAVISRLSSLTYITRGFRPSDKGWARSFRSWDKGKGGKGGQGRGGGRSQKIFFRAPRALVWSEKKGNPRPPGPLPWIRLCI